MAARTFRIALIPLCFFALTACNTVSGLGKDVKAGGAAIEEGADKVKKELSQ